MSNDHHGTNIIDAADRFAAAASLAQVERAQRAVAAILNPEAARARKAAEAVNRLLGL
jgi:hypothetical protein